jgi:hypothetical protein
MATMEWAATRIPRYSQQYLRKNPACLAGST